MIGYRFDLTCPLDGGPVEAVASGTSDGRTTRAIARCSECGATLHVEARVAVIDGAHRATAKKREQLASARQKANL